jgi:uncharacterized RDD family membrane protein YckC
MTGTPARVAAGIVVRLTASAYEAVLTAALAMAIGFVLLPWIGAHAVPAPEGRIALPGTRERVLTLTCLLAAFGAYYTWMWSGGRATLPMRTWRLELATIAGMALDPRRALLRFAAWWFGPACALGGYIALRATGHGRWAVALLCLNYAWALVDRDRQYLHDRIAGSRLLRSPARNPGAGLARRQDF